MLYSCCRNLCCQNIDCWAVVLMMLSLCAFISQSWTLPKCLTIRLGSLESKEPKMCFNRFNYWNLGNCIERKSRWHTRGALFSHKVTVCNLKFMGIPWFFFYLRKELVHFETNASLCEWAFILFIKCYNRSIELHELHLRLLENDEGNSVQLTKRMYWRY